MAEGNDLKPPTPASTPHSQMPPMTGVRYVQNLNRVVIFSDNELKQTVNEVYIKQQMFLTDLHTGAM